MSTPSWRGDRHLRLRDVVAGVTVALVLIPQAVAYAQLAGMPAANGLLAAAIPPLIASFLASSPYLQPGPTAITSLLCFSALSPLAPPGSAEFVRLGLVLALLVGLIRLAIGLLHAGVISYLLSEPLLIGFVPAAAILIVASQIPLVLGTSPTDARVLARAASSLSHPAGWQLAALGVAVTAATIIVVARRIQPLVPGVLIAVVLTTAVATFTDYSAPVVGDLGSLLPMLTTDFPLHDIATLLPAAVIIALLGFAEASSIARTYAAVDRQPWDASQEFVAQGAANIAAGLTNGMPVGASFSRSALNRLAGARSTFSGFVTGVTVLCLLPFGFLIADLPTAVLGAIVIVAVVPLIRLDRILDVLRWSRPQSAITLTTFVLTLAFEPHVERALIAGIGLAILVHLWRELELDVTAAQHDGTLELSPVGVLWFGSAHAFEDRFVDLLAAHPDVTRLNLKLDRLGRIDLSGALTLDAVVRDARSAGLTVHVSGAPPQARRIVGRVLQSHRT